MPRRGLTREGVIAGAAALMEEKGFPNFSMRELAERLDVKTASLYNHIRSMEELCGEVGLAAAAELGGALDRAAAGRARDEAVMAAALAYRRYVKDHPERYAALMYLPRLGGEWVRRSAAPLLEPILRLLEPYRLGGRDLIHAQRIFRAVTHGFLSQERAGYFAQDPADCQESYRMAVSAFIEQLKGMERGTADGKE